MYYYLRIVSITKPLSGIYLQFSIDWFLGFLFNEEIEFTNNNTSFSMNWAFHMCTYVQTRPRYVFQINQNQSL